MSNDNDDYLKRMSIDELVELESNLDLYYEDEDEISLKDVKFTSVDF